MDNSLGRDPFSRLDDSFAGIGGRSPSPEYRKPFSPEDYRPIKQKLLDYGGQGLRGIFNTLSFAGDHVRGGLAGDITQRKSGRQLLDSYHLTDANDKGWGSWGAGLAADVLTDPLTYTGFGPTTGAMSKMGSALSKAGTLEGWGRKAAMEGFHATESGLAAAGHTADEIAHLSRGGMLAGVNTTPWRVASAEQEGIAQNVLGRGIAPHEPMGGWAGIGVPYGPKATFTGGALGRGLAGIADKVGDKLSYGTMAGRGLGYLFDSKRANALGEASQRGYATRGAAAAEKALSETRGTQAGALEKLEPLLRDPAMQGREMDLLSQVRSQGEHSPLSMRDPALMQQVSQTGAPAFLEDSYKAQRMNMRKAGLPAEQYKDAYGTGYLPRQPAFKGELESPLEAKMFPTSTSADMHRDTILNQAGATERLQDWSTQFSGIKGNTTQAEKTVFKDLVHDHIDKLAMSGNHTPVDRNAMHAFRDQSKAIVAEMAKLSPAHVTQNVPMYSPDLIGGVDAYGRQYAKKMASSAAAVGALSHLAEDPAKLIAAGKQYLSLRDAARQMGFRSFNPDPALGITEQHGFGPELLKALAPKGAEMAEPLFRQTGQKGVSQALDRFAIDASHLPDLLRSQAKGQMPEGLRPAVKAWDSMTNAFKSLAYPIWPASHSKNAVTAAINNLRTDTPWGAASSIADQIKLMRNPSVTDAGVNAERKAQFQHAKIFSGMDSTAEAAGMDLPTRIETGNRITMPLPGADRAGKTGSLLGDVGNLVGKEGVWDTGAAIGKTAWDTLRHPTQWKKSLGDNLGIKGVGGMERDTLPAVQAGRTAGLNIEDAFRGAQYKGMIRQGYSPEQAGKVVNQTHFDYGASTDFEKNVMRRAMPFYTFARKNLPLQVNTMLSRPGIALGQLYPAMQDRHKDNYVPDYMAGGIPVPLGETGTPGHQKFISSFGLPLEEALSKFDMTNGLPDFRKTAMGFASGLNPMIKGPLEAFTGKQFFSGRNLADLQAPTSAKLMGRMFGEENPQMLAQVLANTPATRFFTSFDRAVDPRKSWLEKSANLLTGVKVSDVDIDKQKAIEMREALNGMMSSSPHLSSYTNWYPRAGQEGNLSPQEIEELRAATNMHRDAVAYVEKRKAMAAQGLLPK